MIDETLEAEFALRKRHPDRDTIYDEHKRRSAIVRAESACILDQRYAAGPRCLIDIFSAGDHAPVLFFIHGGYWRALDKSYVSFIAEPFRNAGITVVVPGYDLVPGIRVGGIVEQMRLALDWIVNRLAPERVVVSGHSAGGQLAAMLALDQAVRGEGPIVGLAAVSGAFDLRPLLRTSINADLNLSAEEAAEASPLLRVKALMGVRRWCPCSASSAATRRKGSSNGQRILSRHGVRAARRRHCARSPAEITSPFSTRLRRWMAIWLTGFASLLLAQRAQACPRCNEGARVNDAVELAP